jgi:hypothetical protein
VNVLCTDPPKTKDEERKQENSIYVALQTQLEKNGKQNALLYSFGMLHLWIRFSTVGSGASGKLVVRETTSEDAAY